MSLRPPCALPLAVRAYLQRHPHSRLLAITTHVDRVTRAGLSGRDQPDGGVKQAETAGIGGDNLLPCAAGADHYMGIGDVGCSARREQPANICRVHPAEVDDVGCRLANQARQPDLPIRPPDCLGQCSRRNGDSGTCFTCTGKENDYAAIVSV
jgi:hypothetical protein